ILGDQSVVVLLCEPIDLVLLQSHGTLPLSEQRGPAPAETQLHHHSPPLRLAATGRPPRLLDPAPPDDGPALPGHAPPLAPRPPAPLRVVHRACLRVVHGASE